MTENDGHEDASNRGNNLGLGLMESNDVGQETTGGQATSDMPSGFGIDALLALHPEEIRNVMVAIANSLEGGNHREDPQTSSQSFTIQAPHAQSANPRNVMDTQIMVYPNSTFENASQQGPVPQPRQANISHFGGMPYVTLLNQNGRAFQPQTHMGRQVMPNGGLIQGGIPTNG